MRYVTYYEDDRIDNYLSELAKRVIPLINNADANKIIETLNRINDVRGFYTLLPYEKYGSENESLDLASDEHNFLKKINDMSNELLFLIQGKSGERWQREASIVASTLFNSGLSSLQSAKKFPLDSLPDPELYDLDKVTDKEWKKQLKLEITLDTEAEGIEKVPSIKEIEDTLKTLKVASNFIIQKSLKSKGRPKSPPNVYLKAAVAELDLCFREYFTKFKGRKNGTRFETVAFEILCDEFFGANKKEQIKVAINSLPDISSRKAFKQSDYYTEI